MILLLPGRGIDREKGRLAFARKLLVPIELVQFFPQS